MASRFDGELMRKLRWEFGWTQRDLASHAHISVASLSAIENAGTRCDPRASTIFRLADAFGIDPRAFASVEVYRKQARAAARRYRQEESRTAATLAEARKATIAEAETLLPLIEAELSRLGLGSNGRAGVRAEVDRDFGTLQVSTSTTFYGYIGAPRLLEVVKSISKELTRDSAQRILRRAVRRQ